MIIRRSGDGESRGPNMLGKPRRDRFQEKGFLFMSD